MSTPEMILYGKADCGLCDQAQQLLAAAGLEARHVDVEADDELMAQYGLRIPVLADGQGRAEALFQKIIDFLVHDGGQACQPLAMEARLYQAALLVKASLHAH